MTRRARKALLSRLRESTNARHKGKGIRNRLQRISVVPECPPGPTRRCVVLPLMLWRQFRRQKSARDPAGQLSTDVHLAVAPTTHRQACERVRSLHDCDADTRRVYADRTLGKGRVVARWRTRPCRTPCAAPGDSAVVGATHHYGCRNRGIPEPAQHRRRVSLPSQRRSCPRRWRLGTPRPNGFRFQEPTR